MTIPELVRLEAPDPRARRPGVYFLFWGNRASRHDPYLGYVGSSDNVHQRLKAHPHYSRINELQFATWLPVAWPWHLAVEALYIRAYRPKHNRALREPRAVTLETDVYRRNDEGTVVPKAAGSE